MTLNVDVVKNGVFPVLRQKYTEKDTIHYLPSRFRISDPITGIDSSRAVHAHHRVEFHSLVPAAGSVRAQTKILDIIDRGNGKGAMLVVGREI